MKKVAAVVVTYNRKNLLLENVQSLLGQTFSDVQIIIVPMLLVCQAGLP